MCTRSCGHVHEHACGRGHKYPNLDLHRQVQLLKTRKYFSTHALQCSPFSKRWTWCRSTCTSFRRRTDSCPCSSTPTTANSGRRPPSRWVRAQTATTSICSRVGCRPARPTTCEWTLQPCRRRARKHTQTRAHTTQKTCKRELAAGPTHGHKGVITTSLVARKLLFQRRKSTLREDFFGCELNVELVSG